MNYETIDKERITTQVKWGVCSNPNNALTWFEHKCIDIGKNCFTLETIIHELNELEIAYLLQQLGYPNSQIIIKKDSKILTKKLTDDIDECHTFISHILSPYGEDTILYPYINEKYEEQLLGDSKK